MSDALKLRRRTTRVQRLAEDKRRAAALQVLRQELLTQLATVSDWRNYRDLGELVADYAISGGTAVLVSGLAVEPYSMGRGHVGTLVQKVMHNINAVDLRGDRPICRYTCNGRDIAMALRLNSDITLGDLSGGADVTEFVRHVRHHPRSN